MIVRTSLSYALELAYRFTRDFIQWILLFFVPVDICSHSTDGMVRLILTQATMKGCEECGWLFASTRTAQSASVRTGLGLTVIVFYCEHADIDPVDRQSRCRLLQQAGRQSRKQVLFASRKRRKGIGDREHATTTFNCGCSCSNQRTSVHQL